jgi:hypothetical protein
LDLLSKVLKKCKAVIGVLFIQKRETITEPSIEGDVIYWKGFKRDRWRYLTLILITYVFIVIFMGMI